MVKKELSHNNKMCVCVCSGGTGPRILDEGEL
jgi:hypothetical protein